jgi:hypothetical protein
MGKRILLCVLAGVLSLAAIRGTRADLEVNLRVDKVVLNDGTEIPCMVLMASSKSVLIVESDPADPSKARQRVIPANTVAKIIRGTAVGETAGFQTDKEVLQKVIQGSGYRKDEALSDKELKKAQPLQGPKGNETAKESKAARVAVNAASLLPSTGKIGANELAEAYLSRFPALKTAAQNMLGLEQTAQLMDLARRGDPQIRKEVETFILPLLSTGSSALDAKAPPAAPQTAQPMVLQPNNISGAAAPAAPAAPAKNAQQ